MGVVAFYPKKPSERFSIGLDFTDEMPEGVTIASGTCSARVRKTEADATSAVLDGGTTATIDADTNTAKIIVNGGTLGVWYEIIFQVTLSNGQLLEGKAIFYVDR